MKKLFKIKEFISKHASGLIIALESFGKGSRLRIRNPKEKKIKDITFNENGEIDGGGTEFLEPKIDEIK